MMEESSLVHGKKGVEGGGSVYQGQKVKPEDMPPVAHLLQPRSMGLQLPPSSSVSVLIHLLG